MATNEDILTFTMKWYDKFLNAKSIWTKEDDISFAQECTSLGFKAIYRTTNTGYSNRKNTLGELDYTILIDENIEPYWVGSLIFSKWRELRESGFLGEYILSELNRQWFLGALTRFVFLASKPGEYPHIFNGEAVGIEIISNRIRPGFHPATNDEIEQHLTIKADGEVHFSTYLFGDGNEYQVARNDQFSVLPKKALKVLRAVKRYFSGNFQSCIDLDAGDWKMTITNQKNTSYLFRGALSSGALAKFDALSGLIRFQLDRPELWVFEGK
jgi:hypothetical protein